LYGSFLDAVCDKCYIVPCWIVLLTTVQHTSALRALQYFVLLWLIVAEVASACVRFQAYFTAPVVSTPSVEGFDFVSSAVKADHIGKAKQTFEMVGTALFVLPYGCRYAGLALLLLAVPLAYESVRRKVKRRVVYVLHDARSFDHRTIKFLHQARGLGSKLIVGIPGTSKESAEMMMNVCSVPLVDEVVAEAPPKADLMYLEKRGIDYVVSLPSQGKLTVTDEVVAGDRCLVIGDDGVARPLKLKTENHKD
jgi:phosphatidylglycerophosphate synthase